MIVNMRKVTHGGYPTFIKPIDFIIINSVLILSGWLLDIKTTEKVMLHALLFSTVFLLFGEYTKCYLYRHKKNKFYSRSRLFLTGFLALGFIESVRTLITGFDTLGYLALLDSRFISATVYWYALPLPFLYVIRVVIANYSAKKCVRVAIIGVTESGLAAEQALRHGYSDIRLELAFYDDRDPQRFRELKGRMTGPFKGSVMTLVAEARAGHLDEVYVALPMVALKRIRNVLGMLSDTTVNTYIVPDLYTYSRNISQIRYIHDLQAIGIFSSPFEGGGAIVKRAEDLILGSVIIIMISLLLFIIAVGVKITSEGPVFFEQDRYGLSGQRIKVKKFRTMRVMENSDRVVQATRNDPRVTRFGSFLRKTSLDELPQFINVLQGNMSIVGPRPHAVTHNELYRRQVENYMIRHKVKPGITGLAQVNGYRGEIDALFKLEKRVQYDIEYIQNWSLWLDIKIIFKTIFKGFIGKNAY